MPKLETKPLSWFKIAPQARKHFEEADLRQLGDCIKARGQYQPVLAKPDGTLIAGERRYRAAKLVGLPTLDVVITEEPLTDTQVKVIQLTENLHRADLKDSEKWRACEELLRLNPGWASVKRIACVLASGVSIVASGPELSLDDLIEALGEAQKEAKKAREHGYTAKTFAAAMKDKSKVGN